MRFFIWLPLLASLAAIGACTEGVECQFNSQCGEGYYCIRGLCRQDCRVNTDCQDGFYCDSIGQCIMGDASIPGSDASRLDAGPADADPPPPPPPPPPPQDASAPDASRPDASTGAGGYLDRCASDTDCRSGVCVPDVGGTSMCTIGCAAHRDCASEHVCAAGLCVPDNTGAPCSSSSPSTCSLGLCLASATTGSGECARTCDSATDCPAGFACTDTSGMRLCVDIESPCDSATDCLTGSCLSAQGCTATCRTAADCPRRYPGLPAYTCAVAFGSSTPICVPPSDILGADPVGAVCDIPRITCRSGLCDDADPVFGVSGARGMCTQSCTQEGGCGPGLGCFPVAEGSSINLVCARAGSRAITQSCASGRECDSGLCDATAAICTRLCSDDGLCPTGMTCSPVPGTSVAICRR